MEDTKGKFWDRGVMAIAGCTKVSSGCRGCWSEKQHVMRMAQEKMRDAYPPSCITEGHFNGHVKVNYRLIDKALKNKTGQVQAYWNDIYHPGVSDDQVVEILRAMSEAIHHTILIITKRPERAATFSKLMSLMSTDELPRHIWHIVTMEDQLEFNRRIGHYLDIQGRKGIIIEPMLSPVDLFNGPHADHIRQVILGGENGNRARPLHPLWADEVRRGCEEQGIPFYFKGWGTWKPICSFYNSSDELRDNAHNMGAELITASGFIHDIDVDGQPEPSCWYMKKTGREGSGRELFGKEYNQLAWRGFCE